MHLITQKYDLMTEKAVLSSYFLENTYTSSLFQMIIEIDNE